MRLLQTEILQVLQYRQAKTCELKQIWQSAYAYLAVFVIAAAIRVFLSMAARRGSPCDGMEGGCAFTAGHCRTIIDTIPRAELLASHHHALPPESKWPA